MAKDKKDESRLLHFNKAAEDLEVRLKDNIRNLEAVQAELDGVISRKLQMQSLLSEIEQRVKLFDQQVRDNGSALVDLDQSMASPTKVTTAVDSEFGMSMNVNDMGSLFQLERQRAGGQLNEVMAQLREKRE